MRAEVSRSIRRNWQRRSSNQPTFMSALYNSPFSTRWFVLSFGSDSTLPSGPGWDQATGLGTPNGWNFVHAHSEE